MKNVIIRIYLQRLKNETHVQFNENANAVFVKYNPQELGFPALYYLYKDAFDKETQALDFVRKSEITAKIAEQDSRRDQLYRGLVDTVKGEINHFDPAHVQAAERLYDVFKHYGNIVQKTLDNETAAINDLIRELNLPGNAQAVQLLNLSTWLYRLSEENRLFAQYMTERYVETAEKTPLRMTTTRAETDQYYHAIVGQIENQILAGTVINPAFINELNAVIERFKHILAQEIGERKPTLKNN
jgi:hypothetical protein